MLIERFPWVVGVTRVSQEETEDTQYEGMKAQTPGEGEAQANCGPYSGGGMGKWWAHTVTFQSLGDRSSATVQTGWAVEGRGQQALWIDLPA